MTSNIIMRPYRADGIPAVLQLWKDAEAVPGPTDNATAIEIRLQRDAELFVLATHGEGIVGSLLGGWNGWRGNMARLAVHLGYRRRGIARQLVAEVEARPKDLGCRHITSLVFIDEPGALELWSGAGCQPEAEIGPY